MMDQSEPSYAISRLDHIHNRAIHFAFLKGYSQPQMESDDNSDEAEKQFENFKQMVIIDRNKREKPSLQDMQIHWNDIIGQNDLKDILKDNLNHKKYRKIHFTGPPGNGKKMMARALATEGNLRFLLLRPEMIEGYNPARNIRIAFEYAAEVASSVLVIDCIDDLIGDGTSDQAKTIMAEMETQMSKVDITVIVTSSLCDLLPEEFMINFNVHAYFEKPLKSLRCQFFQNFLQQQNLTVQESEIDQMAQRSKGFSYTDLDKITETFDEIGKNRITENILKLIDIQHMTINPDTI